VKLSVEVRCTVGREVFPWQHMLIDSEIIALRGAAKYQSPAYCCSHLDTASEPRRA
jgi:hypothetical protein